MAMHSYRQVRDVLGQVSRYHEDLQLAIADEPSDGQLAPLSGYLAAHEAAVAHVLDGCAPADREAVLNTWLQYVPDEAIDAVFKSRDFRTAQSADDALAMAAEFDDALVSLYRSLADNAQSPPRVNEVFRNLLEQPRWRSARPTRPPRA